MPTRPSVHAAALLLTLASLTACSGGNGASGTAPLPGGTLPAPEDVIVVPEDGAAVVFWSADPDQAVKGYRVYRDGQPAAPLVPAALPARGPSAQTSGQQTLNPQGLGKRKRYALRIGGLVNLKPATFGVVAIGTDGKEGSPSEKASATPQVCTRLLTQGTDMGGYYQNIRVRKGTVNLSTASVTVNGTPIGLQPDGIYYGHLPAPLAAGDGEFLRVQDGACSLAAYDVVPESPALTAPAAGTSAATNTALNVTWTSATAPDRFVVWATWLSAPDTGSGWTSPDLPGSARSFSIPAGSLPPGKIIKLRVYAYNDGTETFAGAYEAGSRLAIRAGDEGGHDVTTLAQAEGVPVRATLSAGGPQ